ncbi:MAG: response regulator [Rhodospirillales bacterium]|nr:response regulator [Rhodospirillales bacterium]
MARILLIDDEELVRTALRKALEASDHEVVEAENGDLALDLHKKQPFDLIITDIIMPGKEGIETIMDLKQENPELPIIAISGGGPDRHMTYLETAKFFGADHMLTKPFSSEALHQCVDTCLGK